MSRAHTATRAPGNWAERAECKDIPNEQHVAWFFPGNGRMTPDAHRLCSRCPVREDCLRHALEAPEMFGIWGDTDERDRRRMRVENGVILRAFKPIDHGTNNGFAQHLRRGEKPCERCRIAKVAYEQERRRERDKRRNTA